MSHKVDCKCFICRAKRGDKHSTGCKCRVCCSFDTHSSNCKCAACNTVRGSRPAHKVNCVCWACKQLRGEPISLEFREKLREFGINRVLPTLTKAKIAVSSSRSWEQRVGTITANRMRNNLSKQMSLQNESGKMSKKWKQGYVNGVWFTSSWEEKFLKIFFYLAATNKIFTVSRAGFAIKYMINGKVALYTPDYAILRNGIPIVIIEVKVEAKIRGYEGPITLIKLKALSNFCWQLGLKCCLFTDRHFNYLQVNPEPSSLNKLIFDIESRCQEFVSEKVQRLGVEDNLTNNTPVGNFKTKILEASHVLK